MAENNVLISIKSGTLTNCIKALATAFKTASGLNYSTPATDEYLFSLGNGLAIKVKAYSTSAAGIYAVTSAGSDKHLSNAAIASDSVFIYNKSASGKVLAFGYYPAANSYKPLVSLIAVDTSGNTRILNLNSNQIMTLDKNNTDFVGTTAPITANAGFSFLTMGKLGAFVSRDTYDELYVVMSAPTGSYNATDASVYSGGKLYKCISNNIVVICMKV